MEFVDSDIVDIVRSIWDSILKMEMEVDSAPSSLELHHRLTAQIHITGQWTGSVLLSSSVALARKAGSIMLETPNEFLEESDIQDALAELVNMVGGNLKSIVPSPAFLSLPCVTEGDDYGLRYPKAILKSQLGFTSPEGPFAVLVLEAPPKDPLATTPAFKTASKSSS